MNTYISSDSLDKFLNSEDAIDADFQLRFELASARLLEKPSLQNYVHLRRSLDNFVARFVAAPRFGWVSFMEHSYLKK